MKKYTATFFYFAILALAVFICWNIAVRTAFNDSVNFAKAEDSVLELKGKWNLVDNDTGEKEKVTLPNKFDIEAGEACTITRTFAKLKDSDRICFRTDHTYVRAYIDGEEIYSFGYEEDILFGKTPGSVWHVLKMDEKYSGKELSIELMCPYDKYSGQFRKIVMGDAGEVYLYMLDDSMYLYILSTIPFILGLVLVLIYFIGSFKIKMNPLLYIGVYLIINAIWGFTESRYLQFMFDNAYAIQMLNFISFSLAPLGAVMALRSINLVEKHFKLVFGVVFGASVTYIFLQLFEIGDFFDTIIIIHGAIMVGCGIIFVDNYKDYKLQKHKNFKLVFVAFLCLFISAVLDLIAFYTVDVMGNGFYFRIGSLFFAILLGIWAMEQAINMQKENIEREAYVRMAFSDNLTGLLNQRAFESNTRDIVLDKQKALIIVIDLNGLKGINDNYGHQYGDIAITTISNKLKIFKNKYGELCYRTGGDEFCIICKKLSVNQVIEICDTINQELGEIEIVKGVTLSMAYGYKMYDPMQVDTMEEVISQADKQMYDKKQKMKKEMYLQKNNALTI